MPLDLDIHHIQEDEEKACTQCIYVSKQKLNIITANMYFDIYLVPAQSDSRVTNSNWVQLEVLQL